MVGKNADGSNSRSRTSVTRTDTGDGKTSSSGTLKREDGETDQDGTYTLGQGTINDSRPL
jgi:hypothetical protein